MARGGGRYGNIKRHTAADGTVLDSKLEMHRYIELRLLLRAGEISDLVVHPRYTLTNNGSPLRLRSDRYPLGRLMKYVADFSYHDKATGKDVIEDVKMQSGHRTETYKLKRAIMESMGYEIKEI